MDMMGREFFMKLQMLLVGRTKLSVLMVTYKTIAKGFDDSPVPPGLVISSRTGGLKAYVVDPRDNGRDQRRDMEMQARRAQYHPSRATADDGEVYDLVVVYAGITAFQEAVACACALQRPERVVFVLTCHCEKEHKESVLRSLQASQQIDGVVWTKECGGEFDMRDIREAIIDAWNEKQGGK